MKNNKKITSVIVYSVLALLVILGFYLRFKNLDVKLFWYDEYLTEDRSFFSFSRIWSFYKTQRVLLFSLVMKLYSFIVFYINKAEYMTEFQLRLPNVIIGSAGIISMFFVGKKTKDYCNGIVAATFTAFSWFLIYYSREARFYPLYFLIASFLLLYGTLILNQNVESRSLKNYFAYAIFASLGMYSHSGFWMLFAISNSFIAIAIIIKYFLSNLELKVKIKSIIIRVTIIAIPLLVSLPLFIHLTQKDSDRAYSTGGKMLPNLTYNAVNSFSLEFWKLCPFAKYALIIITIMGILMMFIRQLRKQAAYYLAVKLLPFIIASFLPNNIIKENLKASYIIFTLVADVLIASLFFSHIIEIVSHFLNRIIKFIESDLLATCLSIIFCVVFAFTMIPKLNRSNLYKPYQRLGQPVKYLLEIYKSNNFVITDDFEVNFYLNHLQKTGRFPSNHNAVIAAMNEGFKIPSDINSLLIVCFGDFKSYNAARHLKKINTCNFIFLNTGKIFSPKTIMGLTSAVVTRTNPTWAFASMDNLLKKWRSLYVNNSVNAILDNLSTFNIIDNGDFKDGFKNWKGTTNSFEIVYEHDQSYLSLNNDHDINSWKSLRQNINVVSGAVYCVSAEVRYKENVKPGEYKSFVVFAHLNDKNKFFDEQYLNINKNKTRNWVRIETTINAKHSGNACIRVQYKGLGVSEIKNVRCDKLSVD